MLKRTNICLFLFLFCPCFLIAQNYKAIRTDARFYFQDESGSSIIPIRIDSIEYQGNDTIYYNMYQIREATPSCFNPYGSSWLGSKVVEQPDGSVSFYNLLNEPILFKTLSVPGQSWQMYLFPDGNYLEATTQSTIWLDFAGISDSVKLITTVLKDSAGQIVPDATYQQEFRLSKHNGMIRLLQFADFPVEHIHFYNLAGCTKPETGNTNLTTLKIFDFQPGDEFHSKSLEKHFLPPTIYRYQIDRILERIDSPSGDTVSYKIEHCQATYMDNYPGNDVYQHYFDTLTHICSNNEILETEPLEPVAGDWLINSEMGIDSTFVLAEAGTLWKAFKNWPLAQGYDSCWTYAMIDDCVPVTYYFKGLGGPYSFCDNFFFDIEYNILVYYKKGDKTWGAPLNCDSLLKVSIPESLNYADALIYPNPFIDLIRIELPKSISYPCKIIFYNILGKEMTVRVMQQNSATINLSELPQGIYSYRITSAHNKIISGKIIRKYNPF